MINKKSERLLDSPGDAEFDPELEKVIEEIDDKLGFSNFTDLQDFVAFNEKRKKLIDLAIEQHNKLKQKADSDSLKKGDQRQSKNLIYANF